MSTSYDPHTLIVLPNIGTNEVEQRLAEYILRINAALDAAADVVEAVRAYATSKDLGADWQRVVDSLARFDALEKEG